MKLLLLSTATGEGHNSAAAALQEALKPYGEAVIMDVLKSGKRDASSKVSRLYTRLTLSLPGFFGFLYHMGELVSSSRRRSPIYYLNSLYAGSLYQKIQLLQPDGIICTHIFGAQAITHLREKYGLHIPCVGIMTDYTCSPFWEETRLDSYIIPAKALMDEFVQKGIPKEKLIPLGIPVRKAFRTEGDKEEARRRLGLCGTKHLFVVTGGSMGYGDIKTLVLSLISQMPDAQVAVLCGRNEVLYQKLSRMERVRPFGYTDQVDVFMDAADVLLTKSGGLTTSEALAKRVPLVLTHPIPGCEQKNTAFLCSLGAAVTADSADDAARAALKLATDPEAARRMLERQRTYFKRESTEKIAEYLVHLVRSSTQQHMEITVQQKSNKNLCN